MMNIFYHSFLILILASSVASAQEFSSDTAVDFDNSLINLREGVDALHSKNKELKVEINQMPDRINIYREDLKRLQAQAQDLIAELKRLDKKNHDHQQAMRDYEKKLSSLHEQIKRVDDEKPVYLEKLTKLNQTQQEIVNRKKEAEVKIAALQQELSLDFESDFQQKLMSRKLILTKDLTGENDKIQNLLYELEQEKLRTLGPLKEKESLLEEKKYLEMELAKVRSNASGLVEQKEAVITLSSVKENRLKTLRFDVDQLQSEKSSLEEQVASAKRSLGDLSSVDVFEENFDTNDIASLEQDLVQIEQQKKDDEPAQITTEEIQLQNSIEVLVQQQDMLKLEYDNLMQQMVDMDKERTRLQRLVEAYKKMGY